MTVVLRLQPNRPRWFTNAAVMAANKVTAVHAAARA